MNINAQLISFLWLGLLTLGMATNTALLIIRGRDEQRRAKDLEDIRQDLKVKQGLMELRDLLMDERNRRNQEVARRARALLERIQGEALLADRYWTEAQALENVLK